MEYKSTSGMARHATLREAVMHSVAADGGYYLPVSVPMLPAAFFNNIAGLSLQEISYVIAHKLFGGDVASGDLQQIVADALNFDIPLVPVGTDAYALELFHGPSMSYKDVGARFMARLLPRLGVSSQLNVLVATSGDTGGAVASGFCHVPGVNVFILYPHGRISRIQEAQITSLGDNVHPIAVNADIEECRALVREAFVDQAFRSQCNLVSANTINVARLLPQTFYYFHAYARLCELNGPTSELVFSIPGGNLGNLTAGVIAKRMGLPIKRFIISAKRENDFMRDLSASVRVLHGTEAEHHDINQTSNLSRILSLYDGSYANISREVMCTTFSPEAVAQTSQRVGADHHYMLDSHSALAYAALESLRQPGETGIFLAPAHPAKYTEVMHTLGGAQIEVPEAMREAMRQRHRVDRIAPHPEALKRYLLSHIH